MDNFFILFVWIDGYSYDYDGTVVRETVSLVCGLPHQLINNLKYTYKGKRKH